MDRNKSLPPRILWITAAFVAIAFGIFFRLYPITAYPEYAAKNNARIMVYSGIQANIERSLVSNAPGMPDARRNELKRSAFKKYIVDEKIRIERLIGEMAKKLVARERARKEKAHLMEVDPYYYLSLVERLLTKELEPFPVKGRDYHNDRMLAPAGAWYPIDYHPYTGLLVYKFLSTFSQNISLESALGAVPLILSVLCVIPFFLVASKIFSLTVGPALVGACYLLLSPVYLRRSLWGWFDTDSYNILFPLVIGSCLFLYLKEASSRRKKISFLLLGGLITTIYSLFWRGWLLEHAILCGSLLLSILWAKPSRFPGEKTADLFQSLVFYIPIPVFSTFFLWGPEGLLSLLNEASELIKSFYLPTFSPWPDAFLTVGELKPANPSSLARSLGGWPIFILFLAGTLKRKDSLAAIRTFTVIFFAFTVLLALSIERFALLAVVPTAIGVALGTARIVSWTQNSKIFSPLSLKNTCLGILLAYILWQGHLTARVEHPIYNSTWDRMMTYLRQNTPEEAIVTSWWCPGHFISSKAKRRVTFDGATQNTPQIYWVANLFLENSEAKAASILRMLDLSGNSAVDLLTEKMKLSEAISLIHALLPLQRSEAFDLLRNKLGPQDAVKVLSKTHGMHTPPPAYLLIYNDMVDQAMALEYTGKRNFAKTEDFLSRLKNDPAKLPKRILDRAAPEHVALTWSLAEGPYAQDIEAYEDHREGPVIYFTNGLALNPETIDAKIVSKKFGSGKPKNIYFLNAGHLEKKTAQGPTLNISALLIRDETIDPAGLPHITYRSVLADEKLLESLLFRLYYLKGRGLYRFKLVAEEEDPSTRTKLLAFQVLWDEN